MIDWMKFESFFFKFYPKNIFRIYFIKYIRARKVQEVLISLRYFFEEKEN